MNILETREKIENFSKSIESLSKSIENIKNQTNFRPQWMGSKAEWRAKERISELEGRRVEITQSEQHRGKNTENRLHDDNKRSNIFVTGASEGGKSRAGKVPKDGQNAQKFSKRYKPTDLRSWYIPNRIDLKKPTARHIIVKLLKTEDKTLGKK